jgi:ankyrin repeat protein
MQTQPVQPRCTGFVFGDAMKDEARWIVLMLLPALLLAAFVPFSQWQRHKYTRALEYALRHQDLSHIQQLVTRGADVNGTMREGQSFLEFAASDHPDWRLIPFLKRSGALETPASRVAVQKRLDKELLSGARGGYLSSVQELLEAGADPDTKSADGYSALWHALTNNGNLTIATMLLNAGAKPNVNDQLFLAIVQNQPAAADAALRAGADANERDLDGWTMLMWAASQGEPQQIRSLLKYGADPLPKSRTQEGEIVNAQQIAVQFRDYALRRGVTKQELDEAERLLRNAMRDWQKTTRKRPLLKSKSDAAKLAGAKR